ncbi:transglutaminase-like domain-containing protein [Caenimonas koreensis]|uniref:transglutaminase-like domain-containing protein n=1 Tax=Caenimonas koreensis TaxID=367474 RepID=UPI001E597BEB
MRLRAHALTQLCKNDREKAMAIYGFVKRMPFHKPIKIRLRTAREVIDAGRGDAEDKCTALIALLRASDIPARIRYIELRGEILRGLTSGVASAVRSVAEIWLNDRWNSTDTYIFDAAYMAAARERLKKAGWDWGYGIHREGNMIWPGAGDAWLGGMPTDRDPMVMSDMGVYNDPMELLDSAIWRASYPRLARSVQWNVLAPMMERVVRELREEALAPVPAPRASRPHRSGQ